MKYAVTVEYKLKRVVTVHARTGKKAALEALKTVKTWKDVQAPEVINIEMALPELQK